jgi:hypothetical protein
MGEWLSSPEGQQGSSQARSAWVAMPKAPVREGLVEVVTLLAIASNLSQVRLNRPAGTGLFFLIIPGTSCLARAIPPGRKPFRTQQDTSLCYFTPLPSRGGYAKALAGGFSIPRVPVRKAM